MKIEATPQVLDCLFKVAISNLYLSDVSKNLCANYTAAPQPCAANCLRELCALQCLLCELCLAHYLSYNLFCGTFRSFAKCAAQGLGCFAASA